MTRHSRVMMVAVAILFVARVANSEDPRSRAAVLRTAQSLPADLGRLGEIQRSLVVTNERLNQLVLGLLAKLDAVAKAAARAQKINSQETLQMLFEATKQLQEMQMSFNLQYLQLQSSMQNENRHFTMISNIMKTKHETVKNSISNIR